MVRMNGRALLLLVVALGCSSKGGADAASGSGGSTVDAAGGAGGDGAGAGGASGSGGAGGGARGGTTGGGGQGGSAGGGGSGGAGGSFCASQGMACSNGGLLCCVPLVCAGSCVQPPANQDAGGVDAGCAGYASFACLFGDCFNDVGLPAVCSNGTWTCPGGTIDARTCHGCIGRPPPGYVCGSDGWMQVDAGGAG
jgi:hypothetical protein